MDKANEDNKTTMPQSNRCTSSPSFSFLCATHFFGMPFAAVEGLDLETTLISVANHAINNSKESILIFQAYTYYTPR